MEYKHKVKGIAAVVGLGLLASPLYGAYAAITVTSPSTVEMIDGYDSGNSVTVGVADLTFPITGYDFGFVSGGTYTNIATFTGSYTVAGTHTFTGGTMVDFALRDTTSGMVYDIANPADYADLTYSFPIDASSSQNPVVTSPYYHVVSFNWNNVPGGVTGIDFALTLQPGDGMTPSVVPLPAAGWLFGSGLFGLGAMLRRKRSA